MSMKHAMERTSEAEHLADVEDLSKAKRKRRGGPTSTANFGTSRRESHDATAFYQRFTSPELSLDEFVDVNDESVLDEIYCQDARSMSNVKTNSVALIVTSPPYFAGKQYEEALGEDGIPATYFEYLQLLRDVFAECKRVLEPGGRIAVNVANLGRRPYRSLAGDVTTILEDLGLLMRGEVIWWKGKAAGSSCAWGTFQRPNNPVLRDVTERIVIASKGRFDRAIAAKKRQVNGRPSIATITRDEFLEATTDLWEIPPESARRVGHPAPFPVELPKRLIELFTYKGDVVLDPFMGSGSSAVAAIQTNRHFIGFDTDETYVQKTRERIEIERSKVTSPHEAPRIAVEVPAITPPVNEDEPDFLSRSVREGRQAKEVALQILQQCGFTDIQADVKFPEIGIEVSFWAADEKGNEWAFDMSGAFTVARTGLKRTDALWKALGKAAVFNTAYTNPYVLLTTEAPAKGSAGLVALERLRSGGAVFDVVELLDADGRTRLAEYAKRGHPKL